MTPCAEELLTLFNAARSAIGAPSLSFNLLLNRAARKHSSYMLQSGQFSHIGENRSSFAERISNAGYFYRNAAENIAFCPPVSKRVYQIWKNSPPHWQNILNPDFVHMA